MNVEAIVYIARKLHWSRKDIGKLTPEQFVEIVHEVQRQENQDRHEHLSELAVLLSTISNAPIPRRNWKGQQPSDFYAGIDKSFENTKSQSNLEAMAAKEGIKLPKEK